MSGLPGRRGPAGRRGARRPEGDCLPGVRPQAWWRRLPIGRPGAAAWGGVLIVGPAVGRLGAGGRRWPRSLWAQSLRAFLLTPRTPARPPEGARSEPALPDSFGFGALFLRGLHPGEGSRESWAPSEATCPGSRGSVWAFPAQPFVWASLGDAEGTPSETGVFIYKVTVVLRPATQGESETTEVSSGCLVGGDKSVGSFHPPCQFQLWGARLPSGGAGVSDCPHLEVPVRSEGIIPPAPTQPSSKCQLLAGGT